MAAKSHQHAWTHTKKARYYRVYLERDLLGDWALRKVWGGIGSRRGRMHNTGVRSYEEGLEEIREIGKLRVQHGYCVASEPRAI